MPDKPYDTLLRQIRALVAPHGPEGTDAELLQCFVQQRNEEAFTGIVRRHGRMVLHVAQRVLHN